MKIRSFFLTVSLRIVESNPKKFNLDAAELSKRKAFINSTRVAVKVTLLTTGDQWLRQKDPVIF